MSFKHIGWLHEHSDIEIVEIDGIQFALDGWNGYEFTERWDMETGKTVTIVPKYDSTPNENDGYDVIGYKVYYY